VSGPAAVAGPAPRVRSSVLARLRTVYLHSEALQGYSLLGPTLLVMAVTMCLPLAMTIAYSFWTQDYFQIHPGFTLHNYLQAFQEPIFRALFARSLWISAACTVFTVALAYPMAYYVAFHVRRHKLVWIIMMTVPFWTSYLLRVFAWKIILGYEGVINSGLQTLGLIHKPLEFLLYNPSAVVITLTHAWAAFAILPIYVSLEKIDRTLLEVATDLGDGPTGRFLRVTLPLSLPGVIAASMLIFIPTVGDYVTPALVGGPNGYMIANIIEFQFGRANNWPLGAALSILSMILVTTIALFYMWLSRKMTERIA
jgi:spermidine/putrescine transport system permease protein